VNDTLTADYWAITLPNELATSASKSPALLAYIAALNVLDADALLSTGKVRSRLDPAITARKGIERHHIFPRAYLRNRRGITDNKEINQIANMALVEWADNIAISDDAPPVYWPAQVAAKQITGDRLAQQMYWHALPDGWEQLEFADFLNRRRRLMAEVVRDAFMLLCDSGYQPTYPDIASAPAEPTTRTWTAYGVRIADLIDAELLPAGTQLASTLSTVDAFATVLPDGKIAYDDEVYDTPSAAATATRNGSANGWTFWAADTPDGRFTLAALRDLYMQQRST
jgi:RAMA domain-containing protein